MDNCKEYKKQEGWAPEAHEPAVAYENRPETIQDAISEYVWEDIRIGMKQYERGECRRVEDFLKRIL